MDPGSPDLPSPRRPAATAIRRVVGAGALAAAVYAGLAWVDLVPGGWRLRTFFVSQAVVDARRRAEHRGERLAAFAAETDEEVRADVLFIGSSTIEFFDLGAAFPGADVSNRGIGDEPVSLLAERFDDALARAAPAWVVLYAGSVDARRPVEGVWREPQAIASDVGGLLDRAGAAGARVGLLEVLTERTERGDVFARVATLNAALQEAAASREHVTWVPTHRPPIVATATGRLTVEHTRDDLHLNDRGYAALAAWLRSADPDLASRLTP